MPAQWIMSGGAIRFETLSASKSFHGMSRPPHDRGVRSANLESLLLQHIIHHPLIAIHEICG